MSAMRYVTRIAREYGQAGIGVAQAKPGVAPGKAQQTDIQSLERRRRTAGLHAASKVGGGWLQSFSSCVDTPHASHAGLEKEACDLPMSSSTTWDWLQRAISRDAADMASILC